MSRPRSSTQGSVFVRHNVNMQSFGSAGTTTHLRVQNEMMLRVVRGSDGQETLQHIRLQNAKPTDMRLPLADSMDRVAYLHLDASGIHSLVSTSGGENFYFNTKSPGLKPLKRLKGMTISAVGWNSEYGKESESGFIAVGTTRGAILETNILSPAGSLQYLKTLTNNLAGNSTPPPPQSPSPLAITDIYLNQCSEDEPDRFLLLVCVPSRLYALAGSVNLSAAVQQQAQPMVGTVWSSVMMEQPQGAVLQQLLPPPSGGSKGASALKYHCHDGERAVPPSALAVYPVGEPLLTKYCWLSSDGITIGSIDTAKAEGYEMITEQAHLRHKMVDGRFDYPLDVALTEYHALLLYSNRLVALCLLNQSIAFEENFASATPTHCTPVGMTRDVVSGMVWVSTTEQIMLKYRMNNEARHVWRIYLELERFVEARKITSQMQDPQPYQMVIKREAEKYMSERNYVAAAELLAQSSEPFEAIVLKFLKEGQQAGSRNGLKRFLELKLNQLAGDKVKRDILVTWLLDIQLGEIAELRRNPPCSKEVEESSSATPTAPSSSSSPLTPASSVGLMAAREAELRKLREELYCFLNRAVVSESLNDNRSTVYRLINSHLDFETQLHLANKLKDHDVVLKILLLQQRYSDALEVLTQQANSKLFYKYIGELITKIPAECVRALIENERSLRVIHLLPAFYKCLDASAAENPKLLAATFYYFGHLLKGAGDGSRQHHSLDKSVHNFIIQLYATYKPTALLDHLKRLTATSGGGGGRRRAPYDAQQALRICIDRELTDCCIHLYCAEGMYEKAVKMALEVNKLPLARECAVEMNKRVSKAGDDLEDDVLLMAVGAGAGDDLGQQPLLSIGEESRKRVWLQIAEHMIQKGESVEACMKLLGESEGAIRIQDVLAYFPEFVSIEHFKEPLCSYLREHTENIKRLHEEMREATEMAAEIRSDLEKSNTRAMVVKASDRCSKCRAGLLQRPFFVFACRHFFHDDCLQELVAKSLTSDESKLYEQLRREEKLLSKAVEMKTGSKSKEIAELKGVREKLKALLADDCPLCGRRIIEWVIHEEGHSI